MDPQNDIMLINVYVSPINHLRAGLSLTSFDIKISGGVNNDYIGAMFWVGIPDDEQVALRYGAALPLQYSIEGELFLYRVGVYPYFNKFNLFTYEEHFYLSTCEGEYPCVYSEKSYFTTDKSKSFMESGGGFYIAAQSLEKHYGLAIKHSWGRVAHTHELVSSTRISALIHFDLRPD